jgi:NAD(P)-dependent dehydrogenase (short-subunit alcohol dehydrogenase family)
MAPESSTGPHRPGGWLKFPVAPAAASRTLPSQAEPSPLLAQPGGARPAGARGERSAAVESAGVPPPKSIDGLVVAVTGAARGIGRATAAELARRGARVAIGDLDAAHAETAATAIGADAIGLGLDVTDRDSFERFLDAAEDRLGPLGVLVNNAGIMTVGTLADTKPGAASKTIDVNVKGVLYGMQLAIPRMRQRGRGHIVNVISSSAWIAPPSLATYAASKHAARGLSDAVRDEVRPAGIEVTGVYPGVVETDLAVGTKPARGSKWIRPEEVAEAIAGVVERPRADLFVPRQLGALLRVYQALPPRGRSIMSRVFGVQDLYGSVDPTSRATYEASFGD